MKKIITISIALLSTLLTLTGCSQIKNNIDIKKQDDKSKTVNITQPSVESHQNWVNQATAAYIRDKDDINNITKHPEYYKKVKPFITTKYQVKTKEQWTIYDKLDSLGRATMATGLINKNTLLAQKDLGRPSFSSSLIIAGERTPSRFTDKWENVSGSKSNNQKVNLKMAKASYNGWLYNKSHLLAWSLGGDMNDHNLILGTRAQNVGSNYSKDPGGMSYIETKTRDYLYANDKAMVLYTAIPVYNGDELLPRAVYVEAYDIDNPSKFSIGAWTSNQQQGVSINYTTGEAKIK